MEEKEPKKVKVSLGTVLFIIIIILLLLFIGGMYYYYNYIKCINTNNNRLNNNNTIVNTESISNKTNNEITNVNSTNTKGLSELEALKIATEVYENAYNIIGEGDGLTLYNTKYTKTLPSSGEEVSCYKVDMSNLDTIFTEKQIIKIKSRLEIFYNDNWYVYSSELLDSFFSTIFGVTDQGIRPLKIISTTEDTIVATGQLVNNEPMGNDRYPLYIIFKKVNNNWLIDFYE